jgi:hypothetical protein
MGRQATIELDLLARVGARNPSPGRAIVDPWAVRPGRVVRMKLVYDMISVKVVVATTETSI